MHHNFTPISKSNIQARWVLSTGSCTSCPGTGGDSRLTEPGCNRQVCWIMFHHFHLIFTLWVWKFRLWKLYLFTMHHLSLLLLIHFNNVQVPGLTVLLHQVVTSLISGNGFHPDDLIHFHSNGVCIHCFHPRLRRASFWLLPNQGEKKEGAAWERKTGKYSGEGITILLSLVYCKSVWKGKCKKYSRLESLLWTSSLIELPPIN